MTRPIPLRALASPGPQCVLSRILLWPLNGVFFSCSLSENSILQLGERAVAAARLTAHVDAQVEDFFSAPSCVKTSWPGSLNSCSWRQRRPRRRRRAGRPCSALRRVKSVEKGAEIFTAMASGFAKMSLSPLTFDSSVPEAAGDSEGSEPAMPVPAAIAQKRDRRAGVLSRIPSFEQRACRGARVRKRRFVAPSFGGNRMAMDTIGWIAGGLSALRRSRRPASCRGARTSCPRRGARRACRPRRCRRSRARGCDRPCARWESGAR